MIELISALVFLTALLILLKTCYTVYEVDLRHRAKFGVRLLIIVLLYLIMILFLIILIYLLCYLKILLPAVPVEYLQLQNVFFILVVVLIDRFITIKAKDLLVDYCLKKGIITKGEFRFKLYGRYLLNILKTAIENLKKIF
ncbi:hypothetical protein MmarC5_1214 [Methanococcus maripaludis C5]|uniref:Uncharacterized protein n=1 Tax=Methanococcus maripaludis (strain C5 / ATCC BAA-1333) TaxID=402880 RepID=A4FZ78_METM5|nr:hypothetical protein [Methanococcus maripaludis]ABO35512.1 hypothetical protein MmarC5_1214 [Methanococcus maripaludis C5]